MTIMGYLSRLRIARLRPDAVDDALESLHGHWRTTCERRLPAHTTEQRITAHFATHFQRRAGKCWLAWMDGKLGGLFATTANRMDDVWIKRRYCRRGISIRLICSAGVELARRGFRPAKSGCEGFNHAASTRPEDLNWKQIGTGLVQIAPGVRHSALVYSRPLPLQEAS